MVSYCGVRGIKHSGMCWKIISSRVVTVTPRHSLLVWFAHIGHWICTSLTWPWCPCAFLQSRSDFVSGCGGVRPPVSAIQECLGLAVLDLWRQAKEKNHRVKEVCKTIRYSQGECGIIWKSDSWNCSHSTWILKHSFKNRLIVNYSIFTWQLQVVPAWDTPSRNSANDPDSTLSDP